MTSPREALAPRQSDPGEALASPAAPSDEDGGGRLADRRRGPPRPGSAAVSRLSRAVPRLRVRLGGRVEALRRARGLSRTALARVAGLSPRFVGRLERGRTSVSLEHLYHVANALGVPLSLLTQVDVSRSGARRVRRGSPGGGSPRVLRALSPASGEVYPPGP
jgi:transcriptional regulator with XRE-family HTH domain